MAASAQLARDRTRRATDSTPQWFHYMTNCATEDGRGQETKGVPCVMFERPGPLYLSETKQLPDEGYIRHALSYSPSIASWSWTTTMSIPRLPLGLR
jgi:hypothetical protein